MAKESRSREVAESLFDLFHTEVVNTITESTPNQDKEKIYWRLEQLGFRVGHSLAERYTKDTARYQSSLEVVKFLCKEFWVGIYKKQVDNLRTNHKGVFVLQDNKFRLFCNISNSQQYADQIHLYTAYSCGLIRGALANLGYIGTVSAEVPAMPACVFKIHVQT